MPCARLTNGRSPLETAFASHPSRSRKPRRAINRRNRWSRGIASVQTLVLCEDLLERVELILIQLVRWTEAQPSDVESFYTWSPTPTTTPRLRRWTRSTPRAEGLHQERITPSVALGVEFALELRGIGAAGLPPTLQVLHERLERRR